jgi:hypothetical protein
MFIRIKKNVNGNVYSWYLYINICDLNDHYKDIEMNKNMAHEHKLHFSFLGNQPNLQLLGPILSHKQLCITKNLVQQHWTFLHIYSMCGVHAKGVEEP